MQPAVSMWLCLSRNARDRQQKRERGREDEERKRCKIKSRHCHHLAEKRLLYLSACLLQPGEQKEAIRVTIFNGQASNLPITDAPCLLLALRPLIFPRLMAHVSCLLNEICFFSPSERFPPSNEITVVASFRALLRIPVSICRREMEHLRWSSGFGACVIKMNELTTNKVTVSQLYLYFIPLTGSLAERCKKYGLCWGPPSSHLSPASAIKHR